MESLNSFFNHLHDTWQDICGGSLALLTPQEAAAQADIDQIRLPVMHEGQPYAVLVAVPSTGTHQIAKSLLNSWVALLEDIVRFRQLSQGLTDELIVAWNRLNFLHQMTGLMRSITDPWELSLQSLELAAQTIEVENAFIAQEDMGGEGIVVRCLAQQLPLDRAHAFVTALNGVSKTLVCNAPAACVEIVSDLPGLHSLIGRKLEITTGPQTYIGLINHVRGRFSAGDIQVFESLVEQITTVIEVEALHRQQLHTQQIHRDLELAAEIQSSFLPASLPAIPGYQLAGRLISASEVSGDFYEIIQKRGGETGMLVCDIAGKGISAALLAADVRATIRSELQNIHNPGSALQQANSHLYADMNRIESFATANLLILPDGDATPRYASAGHTTALWIQSAEKRIRELPSTSLPLGVMPELNDESVSVNLRNDDILLLYSDGLLEAEDSEGQIFGLDGISHVLLATHTASPSFILDSLIAASNRHRASRNLHDDLTVIVIKKVAHPSPLPRYQQLLTVPADQTDLTDIHRELRQLREHVLAQTSSVRWYLELKLAIIEALTNVITHAYREQQGMTYCLVTLYTDRILVDVYDRGDAFTPQNIQPLEFDAYNPPEGGYGLPIIAQVMDAVQYTRLPKGYNHWGLVRHLP